MAQRFVRQRTIPLLRQSSSRPLALHRPQRSTTAIPRCERRAGKSVCAPLLNLARHLYGSSVRESDDPHYQEYGACDYSRKPSLLQFPIVYHFQNHTCDINCRYITSLVQSPGSLSPALTGHDCCVDCTFCAECGCERFEGHVEF